MAAPLRRDKPYLVEQHCVVHRENLGIDDACKHVALMQDIKTLLRTVYTLFYRASVEKITFKELTEVQVSIDCLVN